jgi:hypothetical protein
VLADHESLPSIVAATGSSRMVASLCGSAPHKRMYNELDTFNTPLDGSEISNMAPVE